MRAARISVRKADERVAAECQRTMDRVRDEARRVLVSNIGDTNYETLKVAKWYYERLLGRLGA